MQSETRKAIVFTLFLCPLIFLLGTALYGLSSEVVPGIRKFRPMKMASVKAVAPSVKVAPPSSIAGSINQRAVPKLDPAGDAKKASDLGWAYFERQEWATAQDWFLTALEWDSSNVDCAKGLVMSVYYSGDTGDAYQLGRELGSAMPSIRDVVPDAVADEVETMLRDSKIGAAEKLLKRFPSTDPAFVAISKEVEKASEIDSGVMAVNGNPRKTVQDVPSVVEFAKRVNRSSR